MHHCTAIHVQPHYMYRLGFNIQLHGQPHYLYAAFVPSGLISPPSFIPATPRRPPLLPPVPPAPGEKFY
eukprot:364906-Chlamydomonas_euryale.AAC.19